MKDDIMIH